MFEKLKIAGFEVLTLHHAEAILKHDMAIERAAKSKRSFHEGWAHAFVSDKFGEATTHWRKLDDRVRRGVGNPCPLVLIGIPKEIVTV